MVVALEVGNPTTDQVDQGSYPKENQFLLPTSLAKILNGKALMVDHEQLRLSGPPLALLA